MERLTEKYNDAEKGIIYVLAPHNFSDDLSTHNAQCEVAINRVVDKLGQLEDIEEDLGIDLITLFKALTNDVYLYHNKKLTKCEQAPCLLCFDNEYCLEFHFEYDIEQVYLKDYGKTWALTKEELQ